MHQSLAKKYVQALEFKTKKAEDEAENKLMWDYCNVGTYEGYNVMGKILTLVKECLHDGTEPEIDYELLQRKNLYIAGKSIDFDR